MTLFVSPRILAEIRDVLTRPKVRRKFPILTAEYVEGFLAALLRVAVVVTEVPSALSFERDPKDEPYLNLAVASGAQFLVSRDNDLLSLMNQDTPEGADFRRRFPGLVVLDPADFLQRIPRQAKDLS